MLRRCGPNRRTKNSKRPTSQAVGGSVALSPEGRCPASPASSTIALRGSRRAQGDRGRRRHGGRSQPRPLSRRVRPGRHRRGASPEARCAVPDRIDDQGDHLGRRHAAHRAGPARRSTIRRRSICPSSPSCRCSSRSTPPPAPTSCARPPSPSPCGTSSRTPPASATRSRARRCAISSRVPARSIRWARSCSSPASNGSTAPARIGSAAWSRPSPASSWRITFASTSSIR